MSCRSDNLKTGVARAPHRSLLKALGFVDEELGRPVIGIANSFNEIIPGHVGLEKYCTSRKDGIRNAGGVPIEFNTIGICDGLAMNHIGMKYSLVTRNIIADSIEATAIGQHHLMLWYSFQTAISSTWYVDSCSSSKHSIRIRVWWCYACRRT